MIRSDGSKSRSQEFLDWQIEDSHAGAYDTKERLQVMDETGVHAQVIYPNVMGFGGQNATKVDAGTAHRLHPDFQRRDGRTSGRVERAHVPHGTAAWWDVDTSVKETERCKAMGLRGVNINSDPHDLPGTPDTR